MSVTNWVHVGSFVAVATALSIALSTGCLNNTAEGDPCDIALSHDECSGGPTVACVIPTNCEGPLPSDGTGDPRDTGNAYCCSPTSTLAVCQPCSTSAAPAVEAGAAEEAGGDAGTD